MNHHAHGGQGWKHQAERERELHHDAEHALASLREQIAAHRATLNELQDRAERAEAERDAAQAAYRREHELTEVARRCLAQLLDLVAALDKYEHDPLPEPPRSLA